MINAFDKEIDTIKKVNRVEKSNFISIEKAISSQLEVAVSSQLRYAGVFSVENEYTAVLKLAVLMAFKFHDRSNHPPTTDEMFAEALNAIEKQIEAPEQINRGTIVDESVKNTSGVLHPRQIIHRVNYGSYIKC